MVALTPFLKRATQAPFVSLNTVSGGGDVLVLAPHPDDETLGCGAAIAELTDKGFTARVVVVTDGSRSHPGSKDYDAARLARTREAEVTEALHILTEGRGPLPVFLRYPDMAAPDDPDALERSVQSILPLMSDSMTALWSTWEADPHPDHGRTARIAAQIGHHRPQLARWSYPIWGRFRTDDVAIDPDRIVRLLPNGHLPRKRLALAAHRTQMSPLIADDPAGFVMPNAEQEHFLTTPEVFLREPG